MKSNIRQITKGMRHHIPLIAAVFISITGWTFFYLNNLTTAYNDSMSHLNLARLVVDSQQPGIAQLGSVWLPLNQLLYLPLIWIGWAWHSGFAGSFVSMVSYVLSVAGIYFIILEMGGGRLGAIIGASAAALNMNFIYLQSTPLTEPVFLATLILSSLYLVKYLKTHNSVFLILTAAFTALQMAGRYDGWFVAIAETLIVTYHEIYIRKLPIKKLLGLLSLFLTPIVFTAILWFAWNAILFGDPLYSFIGPYSAHAQQATLQQHGGLLTKSNIWQSTRFFLLDVWDNIGIISILGLAGWCVYFGFQQQKLWLKIALILLFLSDALFNVLALFFGFSILNVPETHWNPTGTLVGQLFNARYGITTLPFVAVGVGLLVQKNRILVTLVSLLIVAQAGLMLHSGLITVQDGIIGSSSFVDQDIADVLKKDVKPNEQVLLSTSYYNAVMFRSGLDLRQFIYEGVSQKWNAAIARPADYAQWLVMPNGDIGDPLYNSLIIKEHSAFLSSYKLVYTGHHANVYEKKSPFELYVTSQNGQLKVGANDFLVRGVNSYDLAYQDKSSIDASFRELHTAGVNTLRFWLFGDGRQDGFQPSAGTLNEARLETADYIFAEAHIYQIRLIPTLVNNWTDYGGMNQYLTWVGLSQHDSFYTDQRVIALYENYVNHILTRTNSITHTTYADDSAILGWDIANEPRVDNPSNTDSIAAWAQTTAQYMKNIDKNHLITVSLDDPVLQGSGSQICGEASIDFCSAHLYPQKQDSSTSAFNSDSQEKQQIAAYAAIATHVRKPIVMSEIGIAKSSNLQFGFDPLNEFDTSLQAISSSHYSGWLIWNWAQKPDSSYGFSPDGYGGLYTLQDLHMLLVHY